MWPSRKGFQRAPALATTALALLALHACSADDPLLGRVSLLQAAGASGWSTGAHSSHQTVEDGARYIADELLVRVRPGPSPGGAPAMAAAVGATVLHSYRFRPGLHLVRL